MLLRVLWIWQEAISIGEVAPIHAAFTVSSAARRARPASPVVVKQFAPTRGAAAATTMITTPPPGRRLILRLIPRHGAASARPKPQLLEVAQAQIPGAAIPPSAKKSAGVPAAVLRMFAVMVNASSEAPPSGPLPRPRLRCEVLAAACRLSLRPETQQPHRLSIRL